MITKKKYVNNLSIFLQFKLCSICSRGYIDSRVTEIHITLNCLLKFVSKCDGNWSEAVGFHDFPIILVHSCCSTIHVSFKI
jgi:hypothetical protein